MIYSVMLVVLAVVAFICAPIAHNHSVLEGRQIQGKVFYYVYNSIGFSLLGMALIIFIEAVFNVSIIK